MMAADATLRNPTPADFPAILQLNAESEHFLSPLTLPRLAELHAQAAYHRVVVADGELAAFLLALREGVTYDSPNYRWFARYPTFIYVDRVVVSEFDIDPPNEISRKFHARFGFREVGTHWLAGNMKRVSLQEAPL